MQRSTAERIEDWARLQSFSTSVSERCRGFLHGVSRLLLW